MMLDLCSNNYSKFQATVEKIKMTNDLEVRQISFKVIGEKKLNP